MQRLSLNTKCPGIIMSGVSVMAGAVAQSPSVRSTPAPKRVTHVHVSTRSSWLLLVHTKDMDGMSRQKPVVRVSLAESRHSVPKRKVPGLETDSAKGMFGWQYDSLANGM
jgi:hypothetical protein